MANNVSGLFQTLVAGVEQAASQINTLPNALIETTYKDTRPVEQRPGNGVTMTIIIPDVDRSDVNNIVEGRKLIVTDYNQTTKQISVDTMDSISKIAYVFDQVRTPVSLQELYLKPMLEALMQKINERIAALMVPSNFTVYDQIAGNGADVFELDDFARAVGTLAQAGVPNAPQDMMFVTRPLTLFRTFATNGFSAESVVGNDAAVTYRQKGTFMPTLGVRPFYDAMIQDEVSSGLKFGMVYHRTAVGMRTVNLPKNDSNGAIVHEKLVNGIPVQFRMYSSEDDQGTKITVQAGYGLAVIRPDRGIVLKTA